MSSMTDRFSGRVRVSSEERPDDASHTAVTLGAFFAMAWKRDVGRSTMGHRRQGTPSRDKLCSGVMSCRGVKQARTVVVSYGQDQWGIAGMESRVLSGRRTMGLGQIWRGRKCKAGHGLVSEGLDGTAGKERTAENRRGPVGRGKAGQASKGAVWSVDVCLGWEIHGIAGEAGRRFAGCGKTSPGSAG